MALQGGYRRCSAGLRPSPVRAHGQLIAGLQPQVLTTAADVVKQRLTVGLRRRAPDSGPGIRQRLPEGSTGLLVGFLGVSNRCSGLGQDVAQPVGRDALVLGDVGDPLTGLVAGKDGVPGGLVPPDVPGTRTGVDLQASSPQTTLDHTDPMPGGPADGRQGLSRAVPVSPVLRLVGVFEPGPRGPGGHTLLEECLTDEPGVDAELLGDRTLTRSRRIGVRDSAGEVRVHRAIVPPGIQPDLQPEQPQNDCVCLRTPAVVDGRETHNPQRFWRILATQTERPGTLAGSPSGRGFEPHPPHERQASTEGLQPH